jgi:uncharacterized protein YceK
MAGCGTAANICWFNDDEGGMSVYGGVRADWEAARESIAAGSDPGKSPGPVWLQITDMPFSAVADTATLPLTVPISAWRALNPKPATRPGPPTAPLVAKEPGPQPSPGS